MSGLNLSSLLGRIGGTTLTSLGQALTQQTFSELGAYQPLGQAGALLFAELAQVLAAKWNPPAPTGSAAPQSAATGTVTSAAGS